jgi:hypothetical protein
MSGFLSPMERVVFKAGLEKKKPLIWVKPWGLEADVCPASARHALDEGRLLILSPFSDGIEAPNIRRAAWCNQYVLEHCDRMVIGHLNPGGMLSCILSELNPEKDIVYLENGSANDLRPKDERGSAIAGQRSGNLRK